MGEPCRILYVHHRPELGGAPVSLGMLIRHLDRERFHPTVYCPDGPAAELFRAQGADVVVGPVAAFTHVWASYYRGLRWLLGARDLARVPASLRHVHGVLAGGAFDLVHLNDSPPIYAARTAHERGLPVVWHLRSSLARDGADARGRAIARLVDRTGDAVIAIDADVARSFPLGAPASIVHNSIDLTRFAPAESAPSKRTLGLRDDLVSIGLFGYLYAKKGWPDFLRAARLLVQQGVPAQFVVVGGGVRPSSFFDTPVGRSVEALGLVADEETLARRRVDELGLSDSVTFLPFAKDPRDVYLALDVVTFPNRGAGLGRAVIEASACGRPVVASGSLDGAGLVVPDETGYLIPRSSPDALAAALQRLVSDEALRARMGEAGRRHAEAKFDPQRNAAQVMAIYARVLAARGRAV